MHFEIFAKPTIQLGAPTLKTELESGTRSQVTFWKSSKIIIICTRNTRSNVPKSILNCFRDTQGMFCCENTVKTHVLNCKKTGETRKITILTRFCLQELGFDMVVSKDPRQQSTKVEKSKIQCFSFTKLRKLLKSVNSEKATTF